MKIARERNLHLEVWLYLILLIFPTTATSASPAKSNSTQESGKEWAEATRNNVEILAQAIEQAISKGALNKAIFRKLYDLHIRKGSGEMDGRVERFNKARMEQADTVGVTVSSSKDSSTGSVSLFYKTPKTDGTRFLELPKGFTVEYLPVMVEMAVSGISDLVLSDTSLKEKDLQERARALGEKLNNKSLLQAQLSGKLQKAVQSGKVEEVEKFFVQGVDINFKAESGKSLLDIALYYSKKEIVKLLVNKGAVVTAKNVETAMEKNDPELLELFITSISNIHEELAWHDNKRSLLHIAASKENNLAVKLLLANGATVNKKDSRGETPLHVAVYRGNKEIIQQLLINGADVNVKCECFPYPETPLERANRNGRHDLADLMRNFGGTSKEEDLATMTQKIIKTRSSYRGDLEKVIKLALRMEPPPVVPEKARLQMRQGIAAFKHAKDQSDYKQAESKFSEAVFQAPWWAAPYFNLALVQEKLAKYDKATENLELYLLASPGSPDQETVQQKIADIAYAKKKQIEADQHVNRGRDMYEKKDYHGAIRANLEAIRLVPNYARAHANLGTSYTALGDFEKAIPELEEAIRLGEDAAYAYTSLASSYYNLDKRQQAISILEDGLLKASLLEGGRGFLHQKLGFYYYKDGQSKKALKNFKNALGFTADKDVDRKWVQEMINELERR